MKPTDSCIKCGSITNDLLDDLCIFCEVETWEDDDDQTIGYVCGGCGTLVAGEEAAARVQFMTCVDCIKPTTLTFKEKLIKLWKSFT